MDSHNPNSFRAIIFMTALRPSDIPSGDNKLACLLPLGTASFAERVMDSCARAGVRQVDLVVSEQPELVRARLGDGNAWGIALTWHLAKDAATPYQVLQGLQLADQARVVIGHADHWIADRVLTALTQQAGVAVRVGEDIAWTGWYSDSGANVLSMGPHDDFEAIATRVRSSPSSLCVIADPQEYATARSAQQLLAVQPWSDDHVPASWKRMPWGAMSPDAVVSEHAKMQSPVLVGPGCVIERGARVGPAVLLSKQVFVGVGAHIQHAVVLDNTYVDGRVSLDQAVAQGESVQNLKWNVRTQLAREDAMLAPLQAQARRKTPSSSKVLAVAIALLALPLLLVGVVLQFLRRKPVLWRNEEVVQARDETTGALQMMVIRAPNGVGVLAGAVGRYGALLDIVQGRRRWFGVRPRNASTWYALGRDWQNLFGQTMLGFFHAPAWAEDNHVLDDEAQAAADAYMAIHDTLWDRLKLLSALLLTEQQ